MTIVTDIEPEYPEVQVQIGDIDGNDLQLIDRVSKALEHAGHPLIADAFAKVASNTDTWDNLVMLARCMVTVLP